MSREPHMLAVRTWVETVLQGLSASYEVIFSHQSAPPPARPYATVMSLSDVRTSYPDIVLSDTPGSVDPTKVNNTALSERRFTFTVSIFGDDARAHARQLELSIGDDAVNEIFAAGGVQVLHPIGSTNDQHALRGASWDNFAAVDFVASYVASRVDEVAYIDDARIISNAGDLAGFDLLVEG